MMTRPKNISSLKVFNLIDNSLTLSFGRLKRDLIMYLGTYWLLIESVNFIVAKYQLIESIIDLTIYLGLVGILPFLTYKFNRPAAKASELEDNTSIVKKKTKILLVDDHELMRNGLEAIFSSDEFEVTGSVGSGEDAINVVRDQDFDVILMDIMLPGISGLETSKWILDQKPEMNILLVSMEMNLELIKKALAIGVSGYVVKTEDQAELEDAVKMITSGKKYFGQKVNGEMCNNLLCN